LHPERDAHGKEYINQLNRVRVSIKHFGAFPDPKQWEHVGDKVYSLMVEWCDEYLNTSLDELDSSVLIENKETKNMYDQAKGHREKGQYKSCLEDLALGLYTVIDTTPALKGLILGRRHAEDAIRVASYGVQANEFLTLQQFLPRVISSGKNIGVVWDQEQFGHSGNWRDETADYCLKVFLDVVLKIQYAPKIPGPLSFGEIYEHKIVALKDEVEVWNVPALTPGRQVIRKLSKGESLIGAAEIKQIELVELLMGGASPVDELRLNCHLPETIHGYVTEVDVHVSCIPKDTEFVRQYFPQLTEMPWERHELIKHARAQLLKRS
jgi:hypothetical protein